MNDQPPSDRPQSDRPQESSIQENLGVVLKVMGLSTAIALGIKYVMPAFSIPASDAIALFSILFPSAIVALILKFKAKG